MLWVEATKTACCTLFFQLEMAKFGQSVADQSVEKNEIVMLKSANNKEPKPQPRKIWVIQNSHTAAELAESGERWANHQGPYLSLADVLTAEAVKATK